MRVRPHPPLAAALALAGVLSSHSAWASVQISNPHAFGEARAAANGGIPEIVTIIDTLRGGNWNSLVTAISSNSPLNTNSASAFVDAGLDPSLGFDCGDSAILSVGGFANSAGEFGGGCDVIVTGSPVAYQAGYTTSGSMPVSGIIEMLAYTGPPTGIISFISKTNSTQHFSGTLAPGRYSFDTHFEAKTSTAPGGSIGTGGYIHFTGYSSQPRVTQQPPGTIVDPFPPSTLTLTTLAVGDTTLTEQWLWNGSPLSDGGNVSGAHTPTLTVNNFSTTNNGAYSCVYTNSFGDDTSDVAVCEYGAVSSVPLLTYQPHDEALDSLVNLFAVRAFSSGPITYQWTRGGAALVDSILPSGATIAGTKTSQLLITDGTAAETGDYQCLVTDAFGSVLSNLAHLTLGTTAVGPASAGALRLAVGPNPARSAASLEFALPDAGPVRLEVLDLAGRHLATLEDGTLAAGPHVVAWNLRGAAGARVAPGLYFARLVSGGATQVRRVVVVQ